MGRATREAGDEDAGACALLRPNGVGRWSLVLPAQSCVGPIILGGVASMRIDALNALVRALPGRPVLLELSKQEPDLAQALDLLEGVSCAEKFPYATTTGVALRGTFDDFWMSRPSTIRKGVRRRLRRLEEQGLTADVEDVRAESLMERMVAEHGRLEQTGWKGRLGTAIDIRTRQGRFYADVMSRFAGRGGARVYRLTLNSSLVASLLTIERNGILVVLKTASDERMSRFAPGRLFDFLMLQSAFADTGLKRIENYTAADRADLEWATDSRPIAHVGWFRDRMTKRAVAVFRGFRAVKTARTRAKGETGDG